MIKKILSKLLKRNSQKMVTHVIQDNTEIENLKMLTAKSIISSHKSNDSTNIQDYEFKVFSQWGDDGIIQYLINKIDVPHKTFIEFGVENYSESNTRFLLMNNNWTGLIMDGSEKFMESVRKSNYYWKHDLTAKSAFVTKDNINELISEQNFDKDVGIYHIDIDGNDYWVWKATTVINPIIVIVEYQSVFGFDRAITIPYKADFGRTQAHYSNLFYGASILSLCDLADEKGYYFVGCNSAGNNAYFVRKDKISTVKPLSPGEGYVLSKFREARDNSGKLLFLNDDKRANIIKGMDVFNTRLNRIEQF